jgi:hypothetical protein
MLSEIKIPDFLLSHAKALADNATVFTYPEMWRETLEWAR